MCHVMCFLGGDVYCRRLQRCDLRHRQPEARSLPVTVPSRSSIRIRLAKAVQRRRSFVKECVRHCSAPLGTKKVSTLIDVLVEKRQFWVGHLTKRQTIASSLKQLAFHGKRFAVQTYSRASFGARYAIDLGELQEPHTFNKYESPRALKNIGSDQKTRSAEGNHRAASCGANCGNF